MEGVMLITLYAVIALACEFLLYFLVKCTDFALQSGYREMIHYTLSLLLGKSFAKNP